MFNTIKRLYEKTGNKEIVDNALSKGWITEDQRDLIIGK